MLVGEGVMILKENREIQGYFGDSGIVQSGYLINQFAKKSNLLALDEKTRMPKSESEKTFIEDSKDKQDLFREQQQLTKVINTITNIINNTKKFLDFYGNWLSCDFNGSNSYPSISLRTSPLLFISENKTLLINGQQSRGFLFDYSAMTYSIFEEVSAIQGNEERDTPLLAAIKLFASCTRVKQHLLEGLKYSGGLNNWEPMEGIMSFKDTEIQVNGSVKRDQVYQTVVRFGNGGMYKGGLLNGRYQDYGQIFNQNKLIIEGNFVDNSMISGVLYYTDDKIKYVGEVFWNEVDQSYQKHGKGQLYYRNGDIYDGDFQLDKYHGQGKILYDGGNRGYFIGQFVVGLKNGVGKYCDLLKGIEFTGDYTNNKRSNFGVEKQENHFEYRGTFKDGKRCGKGTIFYMKGKIRSYEGTFEDDKKHGEGIEIDENNNQLQTKYWKDGLISSQILKKNAIPQQAAKIKTEYEESFYKFT